MIKMRNRKILRGQRLQEPNRNESCFSHIIENIEIFLQTCTLRLPWMDESFTISKIVSSSKNGRPIVALRLQFRNRPLSIAFLVEDPKPLANIFLKII